MAIFGLKPCVNLAPLEISQFFDFVNVFFLAQKVIFLVLEYRKAHFSRVYCLKIKVGKMAIFGSKPLVNPFRKISIFQLFELLVFIAQKDVFLILEYGKTHFSGQYYLKKKSLKTGHFWSNYPFGKISIFRLFELLISIAQKSGFSFQNIVKNNSLAYIALKKKSCKNGQFWTRSMG